MERVYLGTELKFKVEIQSEGFDMDTDDFTVEIVRGAKSVVFAKSDLVTDEMGMYYVCFDTTDFGVGTISAIVTAYITDPDFPDGLRTEREKYELLTVWK